MASIHASRISTLLIGLASSLAAACGTSSTPTRDDGTTVVPTATPSASAAPRALRNADLAGTSPQNLLLDPMFMQSPNGPPDWGHFSANAASGDPITSTTMTYGATPLGIGSTVLVLPAKPVAVADAQTIMLLMPFVGGPGACSAKLWVSKSDPSGQPDTFDAAPLALRVTVYGVTTSASAFDLQRDDAATQVIAGRTWYLYAGDIASGLADGGFFSVRGGHRGGNFWLTGPEVVPKDLAPLPATMSRPRYLRARPLEADEISAMAAYRRRTPPRLVGARPLGFRKPLR